MRKVAFVIAASLALSACDSLPFGLGSDTYELTAVAPGWGSRWFTMPAPVAYDPEHDIWSNKIEFRRATIELKSDGTFKWVREIKGGLPDKETRTGDYVVINDS